jgi:hypothetical protein
MEGPTLAQLQDRTEKSVDPGEVAQLTGMRGWLVFMIIRFGILSVVALFLAANGQYEYGLRLYSLFAGIFIGFTVYLLLTKKRGAVVCARISSLLLPSLLYSWYFFVSKRVKYTHAKQTYLEEAKEAPQRKRGWQQ